MSEKDRNGAMATIKSPLLKVHEAAAYLRVSPSTLYHWISEGRIVPVKYGNGAVRFDIRDLDRFIRRSKRKTRNNGGDSRNQQADQA